MYLFNGICYNNRVSWNGVRPIAIYDDSFVWLFILRHWSSYSRVPSGAGTGSHLGVHLRTMPLFYTYIIYAYNLSYSIVLCSRFERAVLIPCVGTSV